MIYDFCRKAEDRTKIINMCPVCLFNNKLAERKQGALEVWKEIENIFMKHQSDAKTYSEIQTRTISKIKELEGCE